MDGSSRQKQVISRSSCTKSDSIGKFAKINRKVQRFNIPVHEPGSGHSAHADAVPVSHASPDGSGRIFFNLKNAHERGEGVRNEEVVDRDFPSFCGTAFAGNCEMVVSSLEKTPFLRMTFCPAIRWVRGEFEILPD
jgi:hypothetical protein